jgi:hypothetical protein
MEAMGKAKKLAYFKEALYLRSIEEGSACHRYHGDKFEKSLLAMKYAEKILEQYWSPAYRGVYMRAFVIDGAMGAIYEICSGEFPGKNRRKAVAAVAEHGDLKKAFEICPPSGLREKLLEKKRSGALLMMGMLMRLKKRGK